MSNFSLRDHSIEQINQHFYESVAEEFARTRALPWEGFEPTLAYIHENDSILDLACGNGRFFHFLEKYLKTTYHGTDSNQTLLEVARTSGVPNLTQESWEQTIQHPEHYTIFTCFGFLHHLSSTEQLTKLFDYAYHSTDTIIISRWNCIVNKNLMQRQLDIASSLGQDLLAHYDLDSEEFTTFEFLLDWKRGGEAIRYVRYWTDQELTGLWNKLGLRVIDTWLADGKSNSENSYFVLQKIPYVETHVLSEKIPTDLSKQANFDSEPSLSQD